MFKQTYGFDHELLRNNTPIHIKDTATWLPNQLAIAIHEADYFQQDMSGNYIITRSNPLEIIAINASGKLFKFPVGHFIGNSPRMLLRIYQ